MNIVISGRVYWQVLATAGCCCGIGLAAIPACAQDRGSISPKPASAKPASPDAAIPGLVAAGRTIPVGAEAALSHVGAAALLPMNFDVAGSDGTLPAPLADLADADALDAEEEEEGALDEPALPRQPWVDDGLKREWSIQPLADGPALEVGALGGGKKKAGRLAHVRVSWAF